MNREIEHINDLTEKIIHLQERIQVLSQRRRNTLARLKKDTGLSYEKLGPLVNLSAARMSQLIRRKGGGDGPK